MKIETKFSCGDRIYIIEQDQVVGPYLVGKVSVEHVAGQAGPHPDSMFDNLRRQIEHHEEKYMCFETGVGSGYVYGVENCFASEDAAKAILAVRKDAEPNERMGSALKGVKRERENLRD